MKNSCNNKKFIDINQDIFYCFKRGEIVTLLDNENNLWVKKEKIYEGDDSVIIAFDSTNKNYSDLAIKFFKKIDKGDVEIKNTLFFMKNKCRNFINSGVKIIRGEKIIIMEKIDGNIGLINFNFFDNPQVIYNEIVKFLVDGFKCAYKYNKYFIDIKLENLGFKLCPKSINFLFLDFGAFKEKNHFHTETTYTINNNAFKKDYFSDEILFVYGTVITLLILKLKTIDFKEGNKFDTFIYKELQTSRNYPKTSLLTEDYYNKIKTNFCNFYKRDDPFINILFDTLQCLTKEEPEFDSFIKKIDFYY